MQDLGVELKCKWRHRKVMQLIASGKRHLFPSVREKFLRLLTQQEKIMQKLNNRNQLFS